MAVPFIDLRRLEPDFLERWLELCREHTEAAHFVGGPPVARLEAALVEETGVAGAVNCGNGTDALQLALKAVGVGPGDRVLVPNATFWATFEAVVNVGARPVTVDIDGDDLQMDFELFVKAVEAHDPAAAILVHLYGWGSARLADFRAFASREGLPLVEDAAQAWGVQFRGESVFRGAQISTLSFYPAKVLGACGDAGAVLCSTEELTDTVRSLANHGRTAHYSHGRVGWNSRMGGLDAAFLSLSLEYFPQRLASRRKLAERYRQVLPGLGIRAVAPPEGFEENAYLNVTLHPAADRPRVEARLKEAGIGFANTYPQSLSSQAGAEGHLEAHVGGDRADLLARQVLNLPLFAYMTEAEQDEVFRALEGAAPN